MSDEVTQEVRYVGSEATLEIEFPDTTWDRVWPALVGVTLGTVLAVSINIGALVWWLSP